MEWTDLAKNALDAAMESIIFPRIKNRVEQKRLEKKIGEFENEYLRKYENYNDYNQVIELILEKNIFEFILKNIYTNSITEIKSREEIIQSNTDKYKEKYPNKFNACDLLRDILNQFYDMILDFNFSVSLNDLSNEDIKFYIQLNERLKSIDWNTHNKLDIQIDFLFAIQNQLGRLENFATDRFIYHLNLLVAPNSSGYNKIIDFYKIFIKKEALDFCFKLEGDKYEELIHGLLADKFIFRMEKGLKLDNGYKSIIECIVFLFMQIKSIEKDKIIFNEKDNSKESIAVTNNLCGKIRNNRLEMECIHSFQDYREQMDFEYSAKYFKQLFKPYLDNANGNGGILKFSNIGVKQYNEQLQPVHFSVSEYIIPGLIGPLYNNRAEYGFREILQNAIDSYTPSQKQEFQPKPIRISFDTEGKIRYCTIRDFGRGMTEEIIREYYFQIGKSGKHADSITVGEFGIGVLAGLLLGDVIEVTTRSIEKDSPILRFKYNSNEAGKSLLIPIKKLKKNEIDFESGTEIKLQLTDECVKNLFYKKSKILTELGYMGIELEEQAAIEHIERYFEIGTRFAMSPIPIKIIVGNELFEVRKNENWFDISEHISYILPNSQDKFSYNLRGLFYADSVFSEGKSYLSIIPEESYRNKRLFKNYRELPLISFNSIHPTFSLDRSDVSIKDEDRNFFKEGIRAVKSDIIDTMKKKFESLPVIFPGRENSLDKLDLLNPHLIISDRGYALHTVENFVEFANEWIIEFKIGLGSTILPLSQISSDETYIYYNFQNQTSFENKILHAIKNSFTHMEQKIVDDKEKNILHSVELYSDLYNHYESYAEKNRNQYKPIGVVAIKEQSNKSILKNILNPEILEPFFRDGWYISQNGLINKVVYDKIKILKDTIPNVTFIRIATKKEWLDIIDKIKRGQENQDRNRALENLVDFVEDFDFVHKYTEEELGKIRERNSNI